MAAKKEKQKEKEAKEKQKEKQKENLKEKQNLKQRERNQNGRPHAAKSFADNLQRASVVWGRPQKSTHFLSHSTSS